MALPFDQVELAQAAKPVLPPGLREFAAAEKLSDAWVKKLVEIYATARGKPKTVEDWRVLYKVARKFFPEELTDADAR